MDRITGYYFRDMLELFRRNIPAPSMERTQILLKRYEIYTAVLTNDEADKRETTLDLENKRETTLDPKTRRREKRKKRKRKKNNIRKFITGHGRSVGSLGEDE
ncbi:hypothetical protein CTI12_AA291030 [Artemisia annua]|uniref:Uncharacterized protein n=1 Tax=Artemisia annua TaxID=35608 RepID=A0A2U1N9N9_ARTAN|nr:hypothetical protein CTI12_AA291030 [Artemisia annua]